MNQQRKHLSPRSPVCFFIEFQFSGLGSSGLEQVATTTRYTAADRSVWRPFSRYAAAQRSVWRLVFASGWGHEEQRGVARERVPTGAGEVRCPVASAQAQGCGRVQRPAGLYGRRHVHQGEARGVHGHTWHHAEVAVSSTKAKRDTNSESRTTMRVVVIHWRIAAPILHLSYFFFS